MVAVGGLVLWGLLLVAGLLRHRRVLLNLWREPVLRVPVLAFESDDWSPQPQSQAGALRALSEVLARHRDVDGNPGLMTLGLVSTSPQLEPTGAVQWIDWSDPQVASTRSAVLEGVEAGIFALQLHGAAHCWEPAFEAWAAGQASAEGLSPLNEVLPDALQSRWWDPYADPPAPVGPRSAEAAAHAEALGFQSHWGAVPAVAVPPTFLWSHAVEQGWRRGGVRWVVTPGARFAGRDRSGRMQPAESGLCNGVRSVTGLRYLVRDSYYEPWKGHAPEVALAALARQTRLGRPTFLEIHRCNFIPDQGCADDALTGTEAVLRLALEQRPSLRFMSPQELGERLEHRRSDDLFERGLVRVRMWLRRCGVAPALSRWLKATGLWPLVKLA